MPPNTQAPQASSSSQAAPARFLPGEVGLGGDCISLQLALTAVLDYAEELLNTDRNGASLTRGMLRGHLALFLEASDYQPSPGARHYAKLSTPERNALQNVGLVNYPEIVVGDDMSELGRSTPKQFEQTDELPLSLNAGPVMISVQGMTLDGVYGRLARSYAKDSFVSTIPLPKILDMVFDHCLATINGPVELSATKKTLAASINSDLSLAPGTVHLIRMQTLNGFRQRDQEACIVTQLEPGLLLTVMAVVKITDPSGVVSRIGFEETLLIGEDGIASRPTEDTGYFCRVITASRHLEDRLMWMLASQIYQQRRNIFRDTPGPVRSYDEWDSAVQDVFEDKMGFSRLDVTLIVHHSGSNQTGRNTWTRLFHPILYHVLCFTDRSDESDARASRFPQNTERYKNLKAAEAYRKQLSGIAPEQHRPVGVWEESVDRPALNTAIAAIAAAYDVWAFEVIQFITLGPPSVSPDNIVRNGMALRRLKTKWSDGRLSALVGLFFLLSKRYSLDSHPNLDDPKALGRHKDMGERLIKSNIQASIPTTQLIGEPRIRSRLNFAIEDDRLTFNKIMAHMFTSEHPLMRELDVGPEDYRTQLALFKIKVSWTRARVLDFHEVIRRAFDSIIPGNAYTAKDRPSTCFVRLSTIVAQLDADALAQEAKRDEDGQETRNLLHIASMMYAFGYDPRPRGATEPPRLALSNPEMAVIEQYMESTPTNRRREWLFRLHEPIGLLYSRLVEISDRKGRWFIFEGSYTSAQIATFEKMQSLRVAAQAKSDAPHIAGTRHGGADDDASSDDGDDNDKQKDDIDLDDVAGN